MQKFQFLLFVLKRLYICYINSMTVPLRIRTGEKHRQIKLQHLQKVRIREFGSLVHQIFIRGS